MKKCLAILSIVLMTGAVSAKKVKFAVDMTGQTVNAAGVHIVGDFQAIAGLGADWDPASAPMARQGTTNIYSIVVNIPAFAKYEYKFVNGNLSYESEIVPEASRVDLFADNRWLYVDSLSSDTTFVGAILYGGNAPAGLSLLRYKVNMSFETLPAAGVHVGTGSFNFDPARTRLYSFGSGLYEIISYVSNGTYTYRFFNGNTAGTTETVPAACATGGNRTITVSRDTVLNEVCFSSCAACVGVGIKENTKTALRIAVYPNPVRDNITLQTGLGGNYAVSVSDYTGREVLLLPAVADAENISVSSLQKGVYFIRISNAAGSNQASKLIID